MSNIDRKGPEGRGALTGRGMGRCNASNSLKNHQEIINEDSEFPRCRYERGRGRKSRRGFRNSIGLDRS